MFRYSLRTFLIVCVVASLILAATLGRRWEPRVHANHFQNSVTAKGTRYAVNVFTEIGTHSPRRLLSAVIAPERTNYGWILQTYSSQPGKTQELRVQPNGVFDSGKLIGGFGTSRVLIILDETDIRVIELSEEDIQGAQRAGYDY